MKKIFGRDSSWAVVRINNLQYATKTAPHSFRLVKRFPKKKKSKLAELCIKAAENVRGEPKPAFCSPRKNHSNFLRPVDAKTTDIVPE
jgi:hypothetical protein